MLQPLATCIAFQEMQPGDTSIRFDNATLCLGAVRNKTVLEVADADTEADATPSAGIVPISADPVVHVDRPFALAIRDLYFGTIQSIGKVNRR